MNMKVSVLNIKVVDYICIFKGSVSLNVNSNEVKDIRYVSKQELLTMMKDGMLDVTKSRKC